MNIFQTAAIASFGVSILALPVQAGAQHSAHGNSVVNVKKLSVSIDAGGLAKTTHTDTMPKIANESDDVIRLNGEPEHLLVRFDDDKINDDNDYGRRHLLVYSLKKYAELFHGEDKSEFAKSIAKLKKIIATRSDRGVDEIPVYPAVDARESFHNQERFLKFKHGAGIAFLSSYSNGDAVPNNSSIFYTFQGISADGNYYVALFWPVQVKGWPADLTFEQAPHWLSSLPRNKFTPSLDALDRVIESITLK